MRSPEVVTVRIAKDGDKNFIYSTWLLGVYYGETVFKEMKKDVFMKHYHGLIDQIMNHPDIVIKVACFKDDTDTILGYAVMNKNGKTLHWTFVKSPWRRIGLAKMLTGSEIEVATTLTKLGLSILRAKQIEFNPFTI